MYLTTYLVTNKYKTQSLLIFCLIAFTLSGCKTLEVLGDLRSIVQEADALPSFEMGSTLSTKVQVTDEFNKPIENAEVHNDNELIGTTDSEGVAELKFSGTGEYQVTISKENYVDQSIELNFPIQVGQTKDVQLATDYGSGDIIPSSPEPVAVVAPVVVAPSPEPAAQPVAPPQQSRRAGFDMSMFSQAMNARNQQMQGFQMMGGPMGGGGGTMFGSFMIAGPILGGLGFTSDIGEYKVGEWTEWGFVMMGSAPQILMRRSKLEHNDKNQTLWQMRLKSAKAEDMYASEILFGKGMQSIKRMRFKAANKEIQEVDLRGQPNFYRPHANMTLESINSAVKEKNVSIDVPAGKFNAERIEIAINEDDSKGIVRIWRAKEVPGGIVRAEFLDNKGMLLWSTDLQGYGSDAKSVM